MKRKWLKVALIDSDMTIKEICEIVGITPQSFHGYINGERNPSIDVAKRIAALLNFSWTKFFE